MLRRRTFLGVIILAPLLGMQLLPGAARAAETRIAITPGFGPPGTQFQIAVTGLLENDDFSIAIYRAGDGALIGVTTFTSDPSGTIVANYDSTGDVPGLYRAVVTFLARGNEVIAGEFTVAGPSGATSRTFPETGFTVSGRFLAYWENNGGLRQFGYPITEIISERLEDGNVYLVQYFERARFEYHPEHAGTPYEVLLGQFGRQILAESGR